MWARLKPDRDGLVAAVVQHADNGQLLMLAYMNHEALAATLATRRVTFWSRSRQALWEKGETSGNTLDLQELWADCDGDALLVLATPRGPTCHTGRASCFYRHVEQDPQQGRELTDTRDGAGPRPATGSDAAVFDRVFAVIRERQAGRGATNREGRSYVRSLMDKGAPKIAEKIREEAEELCEALAGAGPGESAAAVDREHAANEAADLLFHALVGLAHRGVALTDVTRVLRARFGVSGIDEKAARPPAARE